MRFLCLILTLSWSMLAHSTEDLPSIRPGFYKLYSVENNARARFIHSIPFGSLVYIYNKSILGPTPPNIRRGIFGVGINHSYIATRLTSEGNSEIFWKFRHSFHEGEGAVEVLDSNQTQIKIRVTQTASRVSEEYILRFYKKRLDSHENMALIAHRGAAYLPNKFVHNGIYPSNTLESFKEAMDWGHDGIELDVRLTTDNVLMVLHDNKLRRVSNCRGRISRLTYDDVKDCMILGSSLIPEKVSSTALVPVKVNSLAEIIEKILPLRKMKNFVIDVKPNDTQRLKAALLQNLSNLSENLMRKVTILTASLDLIHELKPHFPQINFAIEDDTVGINVRRINNYLRNNVGDEGFDSISINIGVNFGLVQLTPERGWERIIRTANEHSVKVIGWTVNTAARLERMFRLTPVLDMMLTDAPIEDFAKAQFNLMREDFNETEEEILVRERLFMRQGGVRLDQTRRYDDYPF